MEGGDPTQLTWEGKSIASARWSPDGQSVFVLQGGKLFKAPFADNKLGQRELVADGPGGIEDFCLSPADSNGMLEMSGWLSVSCTDGPTILCVHVDSPVAHGNHRLYGYAHPGFQHHAVSTSSVVGHLRILMHLATDAVSCQFTDDSVALCFAVILYGTSYISNVLAGHSILNSDVKTFLCRLEQLFYLIANGSYTERVGRVSVETVEQRSAVDSDDITLFQNGLLVGYAMHHHIVH